MMSRKFTSRERVLLVILAVLLLGSSYYLLVAEPVAARVREAEARRLEAETLLVIEQARNGRLLEMRAALEALDGADAPAPIADYDNTENVVRALNAALAPSESYNLVFSPVSFAGGVASRTIDMSFTCADYATARAVVERLYDAPYRCRVTALTLLPGGESAELTAGPIAARLTITFYEYAPETEAAG